MFWEKVVRGRGGYLVYIYICSPPPHERPFCSFSDSFNAWCAAIPLFFICKTRVFLKVLNMHGMLCFLSFWHVKYSIFNESRSFEWRWHIHILYNTSYNLEMLVLFAKTLLSYLGQYLSYLKQYLSHGRQYLSYLKQYLSKTLLISSETIFSFLKQCLSYLRQHLTYLTQYFFCLRQCLSYVRQHLFYMKQYFKDSTYYTYTL